VIGSQSEGLKVLHPRKINKQISCKTPPHVVRGVKKKNSTIHSKQVQIQPQHRSVSHI